MGISHRAWVGPHHRLASLPCLLAGLQVRTLAWLRHYNMTDARDRP